jgi:hypothetical protein
MSAFEGLGVTEDFGTGFSVLPETNFVPNTVGGKAVAHYFKNVHVVKARKGFCTPYAFMTKRGTYHFVDTDFDVVKGLMTNFTVVMKRVRVSWEDAATYTFPAPPPNAAIGVAFGATYGHHELLRANKTHWISLRGSVRMD